MIVRGPSRLCSFHRQTITVHDYRTLAEGEYLNDAIIDFYLTVLYENLSETIKNFIHIYSSHFYSRLKDNRAKAKDNYFKASPAAAAAGGGASLTRGQTQAERSYLRVKSWTKKLDIFSKRMLIFPICEE